MEEIVSRLIEVVGRDRVIYKANDIVGYTRDYTPIDIYSELIGELDTNVVVVQPGSPEEVIYILDIAREARARVYVIGGGSSVVGSYRPVKGIVIDMARLNQIEWYDEDSLIISTGAGAILREVEDWLNKQGYTLGHYPQSIDVASIGGLITMGSIGMYSSGYGAIEDILVGAEAVIPSIGLVELPPSPRRNTPLPLERMLIGSEGCIGIVTKAYLRVYPKPTGSLRKAYRLDGFGEGVEKLKMISMYRVRPDMIRLLDEVETTTLTGLDGAALFIENHLYEGYREAGIYRMRMVEKLLENVEEVDTKYFEKWYKTRWNYLEKIVSLYKAGVIVDTFELSIPWGRVTSLYNLVRDRLMDIEGVVSVSSHIGHIHDIGAGLYTTVLMDVDGFRDTYKSVWRNITELSLEYGLSPHHHGVGSIRAEYLEKYYRRWYEGVKKIVEALDPHNILNIAWLNRG